MNSESSELEPSNNGRDTFHTTQIASTMGSSSGAHMTNSNVAVNNLNANLSNAMGSMGRIGRASGATDVSSDSNLNSEMFAQPGGIVVKFSEKPQERYVWEMRSRSPNVTPASTVLNSPDLNTDVQYALHHQHRQHHHQIRVGRSPGSQFEQQNVMPQVCENCYTSTTV